MERPVSRSDHSIFFSIFFFIFHFVSIFTVDETFWLRLRTDITLTGGAANDGDDVWWWWWWMETERRLKLFFHFNLVSSASSRLPLPTNGWMATSSDVMHAAHSTCNCIRIGLRSNSSIRSVYAEIYALCFCLCVRAQVHARAELMAMRPMSSCDLNTI